MDCASCREKRKQAEPVPYIVFESEMARMERIVKRLVAIIVLLALMVAGMFYYETQWVDEVTETVESSADNGGNAYGTIVSGNGSVVSYGENASDANAEPNP